ncbi:hypothetical protein Plec18167_000774 [Paecilomyces lecythidis]|uniref:DNA (cytosine-5-)-methyltransferase n=1 Tax=Paecilomyces lecythidis TaxID=3004212 RepID=A0ABR3YEW2_9EURO
MSRPHFSNSRENPIVIDDDSECVLDISRRYRTNLPVGYFSREQSTVSDSSSTLTDGSHTVVNDPDYQCILRPIDNTSLRSPSRDFTPASPQTGAQVIDLTNDLDGPFQPDEYLTNARVSRAARAVRCTFISDSPEANPPHQLGDEPQVIPFFWAQGLCFSPGQSVELYDSTFLRIVHIFRDSLGTVFLNGLRFTRLENMSPKYPRWRNELCWIINETPEGRVPEDVPLERVKGFRVIHLTNARYPSRNSVNQRGELYCRLKEITVTEKSSSETLEVAIEYLSATEADKGHSLPHALLRQDWRGQTDPFGGARKLRYSANTIDLDGPDAIDLTLPSPRPTRDSRQYTFGDGFCGAGGVSRGAVDAGLSIKWAFDKSHHAIESYGRNFPDVICEIADVTNFLTNHPSELKVDVSHGSPPCQTFSPAHTVNGLNDDANSACIFSCRDIIERSKPRVHTMEETSGLLERHQEWFSAVIQDFVEIGYSIRWKILDCSHYGVPQSRRRLFIIASGPGEELPRFPRPTHGEGDPDLLPYTTIETMISGIPRDAPDHDVLGALERGRRRGFKRPFDSRTQARTITCGGGENNHHPSGKRGFTNREFACLQTFPLNHSFGPREVRKQIGNAVPPAIARALYREIIKSLRRTDEAELKVAASE